MRKNGSKNELSIKSKLLFNNLDMHMKVILDLQQKDEKRIKSLNTIFDTYVMTLRPFIEDEAQEYQDKIKASIDAKRQSVEDMITSKITVETLNMVVSPVLADLKGMVSTCKTNMDTVNHLWNIEV